MYLTSKLILLGIIISFNNPKESAAYRLMS